MVTCVQLVEEIEEMRRVNAELDDEVKAVCHIKSAVHVIFDSLTLSLR